MRTYPSGEERVIKARGSLSVDGAPITYVVAMAGVVTVLAFVPFSITLVVGGSFPLSQAVYPLVGWILGPIAGGLASGLGALLGLFFAPHTAGGVPALRVIGGVISSFAAGVMATPGQRRRWWLPLAALLWVLYGLYVGRAVLVNQVRLSAAVAGSFINWSALLLFVLPSRKLCARWLASADLRRLSAALFCGTWTAAGLSHLALSTVYYTMQNWPEAVWWTLAPIQPVENLFRGLVGAVIGVGVIFGLRASGLVKSKWAAY